MLQVVVSIPGYMPSEFWIMKACDVTVAHEMKTLLDEVSSLHIMMFSISFSYNNSQTELRFAGSESA